MNFIARFFLFFACIFSLLPQSFAQEKAWSDEEVTFSVFSRADCVHCIALKKYLEAHFPNEAGVNPKYYDIDLPENKAIFDRFTQENSLAKVTPIILV